jgi:tetratricopeptide (TPR) repeat protein
VLYLAIVAEDLGYVAPAKELYGRYAKAKPPDGVLELARFLGRRQQVKEALELCQDAWHKCAPAAVAEACLSVISAARSTTDQQSQVERWLENYRNKAADKTPFLICLASLEELRGRYDQAESLYLQVLKTPGNDRNAVALNNLAWLLALRGGKSQDALKYVERAITVLGPLPALLDTRAVVRLSAKRYADALADLKEAQAEPVFDVRLRASLAFHLAQTYAGMDRQEASKAWQDARSRGLSVDLLHPLERAAFKQLEEQLATE